MNNKSELQSVLNILSTITLVNALMLVILGQGVEIGIDLADVTFGVTPGVEVGAECVCGRADVELLGMIGLE